MFNHKQQQLYMYMYVYESRRDTCINREKHLLSFREVGWIGMDPPPPPRARSKHTPPQQPWDTVKYDGRKWAWILGLPIRQTQTIVAWFNHLHNGRTDGDSLDCLSNDT